MKNLDAKSSPPTIKTPACDEVARIVNKFLHKYIIFITQDKIRKIFPRKMESFWLTQFYQEQQEWLCTQFQLDNG